MITEVGQIAGAKLGDPWFIRHNGTVLRQPNRTQAKAVALQLAARRRDRVREVTFAADEVETTGRFATDAVGGIKVDTADSIDTADVIGGNAKRAAELIAAGEIDDLLDQVEAAEAAREGGARKTVETAITKRREALAEGDNPAA